MGRLEQRMPYELDEVDEQLLDALRDGARTPAWLLDNVDLPMSTRSAIQQRLTLLDAAGEVVARGHGLYELPGGYVPAREIGGTAEGDVRDVLADSGLDEDNQDAVVAMWRYLRDVGEASPKDFKDDVHPDNQAGKENDDWWWQKLSEHLEELPGVRKESQRRFVWVGGG